MSAAPVLRHVWAAAPVTLPSVVREPEPIRSLGFYRKRTEMLLRQYMQASMQMGRAPSILGNYVFRGKASYYRVRSFEDSVNFVLDIEKCLNKLDKYSQEVVARIALQEYSQGEAARLTGQSLRSIVRKYAEALDALTAILLERKLLPDAG